MRTIHSPTLAWNRVVKLALANVNKHDVSMGLVQLSCVFEHLPLLWKPALGSPLAPEDYESPGSDLNGACSLGPSPDQPIWAQQDSPGQSPCHRNVVFVCYTAKLPAHTIPSLFFFLYFKFCFSGFCPISLAEKSHSYMPWCIWRSSMFEKQIVGHPMDSEFEEAPEVLLWAFKMPSV